MTTHIIRPNLPIALLRITVGLVFMAHAIARLENYSLPGFGEFLNGKGIPAGFYVAWAITIFELVGGVLMVLRRFVKLFCIGETIILIGGIIMVHVESGWFVVGRTLGGMEYSVVLIIILIAIFLAEMQQSKNSH